MRQLRTSLSVLVVFAGLCVASGSASPDPNVYYVTDSSGLGRRFDGIGALSGGGGTSIFLRDYPEPQRSLLLDLLFRPGYGASLHMLKVEIGGDAQSSMAVEASHMHTAEDFNMQRGYEGWLLSEAKARNPAILTYGLAWAYPGWVGNGTGSPYGAPALSTHYLTRWVAGMRETWNVSLDFLGQFNEKPPSVDFILALRSALDDAGLNATGLVGSDNDWSLADAINNSSALRSALVALGAHYPASNSTPAARATGLPLYASEDFSDYNRGATHWGAQCWVRTLNRNFVVGSITAGVMWHLASAMDERQFWFGASALNAPQPWSGYYEVTSTLWAFAHTTQFTRPGWHYLPLGAGSGMLEGGGTYVALTDASRTELTIVIEKVAWTASLCNHNGVPYATSDENATFALGGAFAGLTTLEAWLTHYADGTDGLPTLIFEHLAPLRIVAGAVTLTVRVGDVWTLSTVTTATKAAVPASPPSSPFPLPYFSDFSDATPPRPPRLWSDQGGVFEAFASGDPAHGTTLRQSVPAHPICWAPRREHHGRGLRAMAAVNTLSPHEAAGGGVSPLRETAGGGVPLLRETAGSGVPPLRETADGIVPHTLIGDSRWVDVNISASFLIEPSGGADPAAGTPGAMVGARASGNINRMSGVFLAVNASGAWNVSLGTDGIALPGGQIASGTCARAPPGSWHVLTLNVSGGSAAGALDGVLLFSNLDVTGSGTASRTGWAALGTTGFGYVQFDDVSVDATPDDARSAACDPRTSSLAPPVNVSAWRCDDAAAASNGAFDWIASAAANATLYGQPGQFVLRSTGGGSSAPLCLAVTTRSPDGYPLVQLVRCATAEPIDVHQLWVVRADNHAMSAIAWDPPYSFACLAMGGDTWSFGAPAFASVKGCGPLSTALFNFDPVSGALRSEWLPDLCMAACAAPGSGSEG